MLYVEQCFVVEQCVVFLEVEVYCQVLCLFCEFVVFGGYLWVWCDLYCLDFLCDEVVVGDDCLVVWVLGEMYQGLGLEVFFVGFQVEEQVV